MVLLANQSVTFRNPKTNLTIPNVPVLIYVAAKDARLYDYALRFQWAARWDTSLTYSDGKPVATSHEIQSSILGAVKADGTYPSATLEKVRRNFGLLPTSCAYFLEAD